MKWPLLMVFLAALTFTHAQAYVLNLDDSNQARRWALYSTPDYISTNVINTNTHAVRYFLASDAYSATNKTAELNAVRASFAQWMAISNCFVKFEEGGYIAPPVDANTSDDTNIVYWTKNSTLVAGGTYDITGTLGFTVISWYTDSNYIAQADIVFNGVNFTWFTDITDTNTTQQFVDGVALHEIGHFIGLAHSPLGGATMFWRGGSGVNPQTGLSPDDVAGARLLYPTNSAGIYGALRGTVLKDGSPVFGAAIFALDSSTNAVAGTVTKADGTYEMNKLPPGNYRVRAVPLETAVSTRICAGIDIINPDYGSADTSFLPTPNYATNVIAGVTNAFDFNVPNSTPAMRITRVIRPTTSLASFPVGGTPVQLRAGSSNYYVGVASANLPTSNASFLTTGNGLTIGSPMYFTSGGLNFLLASFSVSSNATPGIRDFIVVNNADSSFAYANGMLTILPTMTDDNWDGFDDIFQRTYFAPWTTNAAAPTADPDHDGYNNYAEYISGTIPTNSASYLKVLSTTTTGSGTTVKWTGSAGKRYQLTSRTNLTTATWQNVGGVFTASNSAPQFLDTTATNGMRFYRVQALP